VPRWIDGQKELSVFGSSRAVLSGQKVDGDGVRLEVLQQRDGLVGAVGARGDGHGGQLVEWRQTLKRVAEDRHEVAFEVADFTTHRRRVGQFLRSHGCARTSSTRPPFNGFG